MPSLDRQKIINLLASQGFNPPIGIHILDSVDSTNRYLKDLPRQHAIDLCCAEQQTQGRGRFDRQWFSPHASNLYCSTRWYLGKDLAALSALSLLVAITVIRTLEQFDISKDIGIKWPNDIVWQDKKLGGILIESSQDQQGELAVVIGIGLNVNIDTQDPRWSDPHDKPWCSLYDITGHTVDRHALVVALIIQLHQDISQFMAQGFVPFMPDWARWDYLQGKFITITHANEKIHGIAGGVNTKGQLMLLSDRGETSYVSAGEASIQV